MPLLVEPLIASFNLTMSKYPPSPEVFGSEIGSALEIFVKPILNMTGGNFLGWVSPTPQIISISRVPRPDSSIYGMQLGKIIETSFHTIQTRNQLGPVQIPKGMLPAQFINFFRVMNPTGSILAGQMGKAIDAFARMCIITSIDVTSGGTPVIGPIQ